MKPLFVFRTMLAAVLAFSLFSASAPLPAAADGQAKSILLVDANGDMPDANTTGTSACVCDNGGGACTLRAAIQTANACSTGAPHTITFSTSFSGGTAIRPATDLPPLTRDNTILTGIKSDGTAVTIEIYPATSNSTTRGLSVSGDYIRVHHLWIHNFATGIIVYGDNNTIGTYIDSVDDNEESNTLTNNATGIHVDTGTFNRISGNYIGTDNAGTAGLGNYESGVKVSTSFTTVGTDTDSPTSWEGNVISNNGEYGIYVTPEGDYTYIHGNTIGVKNKGGTNAAPNALGGIFTSGSFGLIGSDGDGTGDNLETNVISGNSYFGIKVYSSSGQIIAGNTIGLISNRSVALPNPIGIEVDATASNVKIGVTGTPVNPEGMRNYISANTNSGIWLLGSGCVVSGNTIGLSDPGPTLDLGNGNAGINLIGNNNIIGTDGNGSNDAKEGNIISGNNGQGISLGGSGNIVAGNLIGLDSAGTTAFGNSGSGISIQSDAVGWRIGTDGNGTADDAERNIIANNGFEGIYIGNSAEGSIAGNYIGTDITGSVDMGNGRFGIWIDADNNEIIRIGGSSISMRNVISGNTGTGILVKNADNHIIAGNYIGVSANGGSALPNANGGINIQYSAGIRIGTDGDGSGDSNEGNLISGNGAYGIQVVGTDTVGTVIAGNLIGLNSVGSAAIPNSYYGIGLWDDPLNTVIGVNGDGSVGEANERNVISGNGYGGIALYDQSGTVISGNTIGLSVDCSPCTKIPNGRGIHIMAPFKGNENLVGSVRIGTNADGVSDDKEVNYISGNSQVGIEIESGSGHIIAGNIIGLDRNGTAQGNNSDGVRFSSSAGTGTRIGTNGDGVNDSAERNVISGNKESGVRIGSNSNLIAGNYIGAGLDGLADRGNANNGVYLDAGNNNIVGVNGDGSAGEAAERNVISGNDQKGIYISSANNNRIAGNYIGVNKNGVTALANSGSGVYLQFSDEGNMIGSNGDGMADALEGNVISGNAGAGISLYDATSGITYTRITGNAIGLGSDRQTLVPNGSSGVGISGATHTTIGQDSDTQRNWISANLSGGIYLYEEHTDTQIIGNRIGITANSAAAGNSGDGIQISGVFKAGGESPKADPVTLVQANVLYNNSGAGIYVQDSALSGHKFLSNFFRDNGGLGIDLFPFDVTANDPGDGDNGANLQQNYPLVTAVTQPTNTSLRVTGTLNSMPDLTFTVQLYAAIEADASGYGEGLEPIHTFSVTTNSSGNASFDQTFTYLLGAGRSEFSAIAISPDGSTSEFGPNLHVVLTLDPPHIYLPAVMR